MQCVFVLSAGRCGTAALARFFDRHPDVSAFHEPVPRLVEFSQQAYLAPHSRENRLVIYVARNDMISITNSQGKLYVETANKLTFFAHALASLYPNGRFIHLVRNPVDVIKSGVLRKWYCGHPWDIGRIKPKDNLVDGQNWDTLRSSWKIAWNWVETNRFILDFMDTLPQGRKLTVKLEDIDETAPQLWQFIGKNPPGHAAPDLENAGSKAPVKDDFSGFLRAIGQDVLDRSGYSV
jgi:hypothetical protein